MVVGGAASLAGLALVGAGCATEREPRKDAPETTPPKMSTDAPAPIADGLPRAMPARWDPVAFNLERGNAWAIPESYRGAVNGPDGLAKHFGKHLPYVVTPENGRVAVGSLALMWGDPAKENAMHPNAAVSEKSTSGHWYDWIRVRAATDSDVEERESRFSNWPTVGPEDTGVYAAQTGTDPAAEGGRNTVFVVGLTHGEYVDFVQVPATVE